MLNGRVASKKDQESGQLRRNPDSFAASLPSSSGCRGSEISEAVRNELSEGSRDAQAVVFIEATGSVKHKGHKLLESTRLDAELRRGFMVLQDPQPPQPGFQASVPQNSYTYGSLGIIISQMVELC